MTRASARTHTYPVCRTPEHQACQHNRLWGYLNSRLTENDIAVVATVFGITVEELLETAKNVCCAN
jgi:hypothetical protein